MGCKYHVDNMSVVRRCVVKKARDLKALVLRNALTCEHAVYKEFVSAWNDLTLAEMELVGNIYRVFPGAGFREVSTSAGS